MATRKLKTNSSRKRKQWSRRMIRHARCNRNKLRRRYQDGDHGLAQVPVRVLVRAPLEPVRKHGGAALAPFAPLVSENILELAVLVADGRRVVEQEEERDHQGHPRIGLATAHTPPVEPPEPPPIDPPPIDPEPPTEPPEAIQGGITLTHDKTMVHVGDNRVVVTSDKPVDVI